MNRIESIFATLRADGRKALMPFLCGGYPSIEATGPMIEAAENAGASVIEIGVPYSDPIADGPVIASAMHEALARGANVDRLFAAVADVRGRVSAGLVAMVSASIIAGLGGPAAFCGLTKDAGFDGLIVPDAPLEESDLLYETAAQAGLTLSLLIAPTTPDDRAAAIAERSSGFVYLIARAGITGERDHAPRIAERIAALRPQTDLPIACGFGISTPAHVRAVVEHADAAIVGSALVRRLGETPDPAEEVRSFVASLAEGLRPADRVPTDHPDRNGPRPPESDTENPQP